MTLRIFEEHEAGVFVLSLHGWLSEAEVAELERVARPREQPLRIDLTHLVGADAVGLRTLTHMRASGARLSGMTPFIALMLERSCKGREGTGQ